MRIPLIKLLLTAFALMLVSLLGWTKPSLAADGNGLLMPASGAVVHGIVPIQGVAQHDTFRKWQVDLLINGDPSKANFVAVGDKMQPLPGLLANLDTTRFPNGNHQLRLRVVYRGLNYDEYFTPLTINNGDAPEAADTPQPSDAPEAAPTPTPVPDQPLGQGVPDGKRWIEVSIGDQTLTAWQGDNVVLKTKVSTGKPGYETVTGTFHVRQKLRYAHMIGPDYNTPDVPWTMYYYLGYAVHGAYWHNNFGRPVSHGCVNMRVNESKLLFEWASVGTEVVVHD